METAGRSVGEESEEVWAELANVVAEERRLRRRSPRRRGCALAVERREPREGKCDNRPGFETEGNGEGVEGVSGEHEGGEVWGGGEVSHLGHVDEFVDSEIQRAQAGRETLRGAGEGGDGVVAQVDRGEASTLGEVAENLARVVGHVKSLKTALSVEALESRQAVATEREVRQVVASPSKPATAMSELSDASRWSRLTFCARSRRTSRLLLTFSVSSAGRFSSP